MNGTREMHIPSHILYADDMMIFCKGTSSNINVLKNVFLKYGEASGQFVNPQKSSIYAGSITNHRLNQIAQNLGFTIGTLPFQYLGVPIFKGKPKYIYFNSIADRVKCKLAAWKASLLSMAGRVQLIRSVIQSMLLHCLTIYSWPARLLKDLEKWMRNFIWSGDINHRKLVTVSWFKVCKPIKEGGLGIRNLSDINEAGNLKNCWDILQSDLQWAQLVRSRVIRNNNPIRYHILSSIWSGAKHKYSTLQDQVTWKIGNGESIKFWIDPWCGDPLITTFNIQDPLHFQSQARISDYIAENRWYVPQDILDAYPSLVQKLNLTTIPNTYKEDKIVWKPSHDGNLSFKDAYLFQTTPSQVISWAKCIWHLVIPPSKSLLLWKLLLNKLPTDDNLVRRGCQLPSICNLCGLHQETAVHLFIHCPFATKLWSWFASIINLNCSFDSYMNILKIADRNWSQQCRIVVLSAIIHCFNVIWYCRNQRRFNDRVIHHRSAINLIISGASLTGNVTNLAAKSCIKEFVILKHFDVKINPPKPHLIKEVLWTPPFFNWVKCNTDGAASGAHGNAACGGIFRDANADFLGAFAVHLGKGSALNAELIGAMVAIEVAHLNNWHNLWLETDSKLVYLAFKSSKIVPWSLRNRWDNCLHLLSMFRFNVTHIYREGNQCADKLANIGLSLSSHFWFPTIPSQIQADYVKDRLGLPNFRFC